MAQNRKCKLCKGEILRAPTAGNPRAPFDAAPVVGGPWKMTGGLMRYQPRMAGLGYMTHYRTCPKLGEADVHAEPASLC